MPSGAGKYLKSKDGRFLFARVCVEFTPADSGPLDVSCRPSVFAELGREVDPSAPGYLKWKQGAEAGVRLGAELAHSSSGIVEIVSIVGTAGDTTERSVAGGAALAVWDAFGFAPSPSLRERLDDIVFDRDGAPIHRSQHP
jgi:hypothetical protein